MDHTGFVCAAGVGSGAKAVSVPLVPHGWQMGQEQAASVCMLMWHPFSCVAGVGSMMHRTRVLGEFTATS